MGVRAEHGGHATVEPACERTFSLVASAWTSTTITAARPAPRDELVDELEHRDGRLEEERAEHVEHRYRRPVLGLRDREAAPGAEAEKLAGLMTRSALAR